MAALGIEPAMIDEETAAAVCGLPLKRFRAECLVPGQRVGHRVLRPLSLVRRWSERAWADATGHALDGSGADDQVADDEDWTSALSDTPKAKGSRHAVAH